MDGDPWLPNQGELSAAIGPHPAMVAPLQSVEIPGFRDAVKRERVLRDRAFLGGNEIVAGVVVKQLSLRIMLFLEHAETGFIIPFRYDDMTEVIAHAAQVLYFAQPGWQEPEVRPFSFWRAWREAMRQRKFQVQLFKGVKDQLDIIGAVRGWIDDAMMDCPAGSQGEVQRPSYVSHPAHLMDLFAAAGLWFTYDEIMDMPLKRLWQHWRLAAHRVYELPLTNPSDQLAVDFLAKGRK